MRRKSIPFLIAFVLLVCRADSTFGATAAGVYPITRERVAAQLANSGIHVEPAALSMSAQLVARDKAPEILPVSILKSEKRPEVVWLRLRCRDASQCLPFLVSARAEALFVSSWKPALKEISGDTRRTGVEIRAGSHLELRIVRDRSQMSMRATTLETGWVGEAVRATAENGVCYRAVILNSGVLEVVR